MERKGPPATTRLQRRRVVRDDMCSRLLDLQLRSGKSKSKSESKSKTKNYGKAKFGGTSLNVEETALVANNIDELDKEIKTLVLEEAYNRNSILILPDVVLEIIFKYLSTKEVVCVMPKVCSRFHTLLPWIGGFNLQFTWAKLKVTDRVVSKTTISRLGGLQSLDLSHCSRLSDRGCLALGRQCNLLRSLNLTNCTMLGDQGVASIVACASSTLQTLVLYDCLVTDVAVVTIVDSCPELQHFDFGRSSLDSTSWFSEEQMARVAEAFERRRTRPTANLRCLHMHRTIVDGAKTLEKMMATMQDLTSLQIGRVGLSDNVLVEIGKISGLEKCYMYGNTKITNNGFLQFANDQMCLSNLVELDVSGCTLLSDDALVACQHMFNLSKLNLASCSKVTDQGLATLATDTSKLTTLNIALCDQITDEGVLKVVQKCKRLVNLDIQCCFQLTSQCLHHLATNTNRLEVLNLRGCDKLTAEGVEVWLSQCTFLQVLDLSSCHQLTTAAIATVMDACANLITLRVEDCPSVISFNLIQREGLSIMD